MKNQRFFTDCKKGTVIDVMKKVLREILSTSLYLLVVLCLVYLVIHFVGQRTQVSGSSMEPQLRHEDNLIVDKITYRFREPERFDIIVFPFEYEDNTFYIKRIIGLPGETVQIDRDGNIFINGEILEEGYGKEVIQEPGRAYEPITLGEDESYWEITGITVPTAGICRSEMSEGIKLSAGHGSGYGLLTGLDLSGTDNGMVERILRLVKG